MFGKGVCFTDTILLQGGAVVDGTAGQSFSADVAVQNGKIAAVGELGQWHADMVLDCTGKVITPGFIDIHRHGDAAAFRPCYGEAELRQGLTTVINGNCGLSAAPFSETYGDAIRRYLLPITGKLPPQMPADSLARYFSALPAAPIHQGMLVGSGTLRASAAGYGLLHLTDSHYTSIHRAMEQALADGALGVSLGMGYAPECFYTTAELIRALAPIANTDIPLTVHMRQEGAGVCESVREMISVAETLRCPLHISHLKAMGHDNWGSKIPEALRLLEQAKQRGLDVSCDVYPYTAGSTQLLHILPPDFLEGGLDRTLARLQDTEARRELTQRIESGEGFDNIAALAGWNGIYLTSLHLPEHQRYLGKNLAEIADEMELPPLDACCELLIRERGQITMIDFMASENDITAILQSDLSCLISDSTYPTVGMPHPRVFGTFPRLIQHFVREKGVLTLEQAVQKMTDAPAKALRLRGKGRIAVGMDADICVFDPEAISETATYTDPQRLAEGMTYVFVGGKIALQDEKMTEERAGTVIRR